MSLDVDEFTCAICTEVLTVRLRRCSSSAATSRCQDCLASFRRSSSASARLPLLSSRDIQLRTAAASPPPIKTRQKVKASPQCAVQNAQRGCTFSDALLRLPQHEEPSCSYRGVRACTTLHCPCLGDSQLRCITSWFDCPCRLVPLLLTCQLQSLSVSDRDLTATLRTICPEGLVHCPNNCATDDRAAARGDVPKHLSRLVSFNPPRVVPMLYWAVSGLNQQSVEKMHCHDHLTSPQSPSADSLIHLTDIHWRHSVRLYWPVMSTG